MKPTPKKHILFVTYGGGHVRMILPVLQAMKQRGWKVSVLGLTTAASVLKASNIPYYGFSDFINADDNDALLKGENLVKEMGILNSEVSPAESIAYLGLSYADLEKQLGPEQAKKEFAGKNRHAFLPTSILNRIIDQLQPTTVVTTNSPRAERAAIMVALEKKIPCVSLVDLFGIKEMYLLCADKICVISDITKNNLIHSGVSAEKIIITGNPAFDRIHNHPRWQPSSTNILWLDQPACWHLEKNELYQFSNEETLANLDTLYRTAQKLNVTLLIRPHPSQHIEIFTKWCQQHPENTVQLVNEEPLHILLQSVAAIITRTSTVAVEAALIGTPILLLEEAEETHDMPLADFGMALSATSPKEIYSQLYRLLNDKKLTNTLQEKTNQLLKPTCATTNIANCIETLTANIDF